MESGRWRRGQAPLLAASSDSTHNRHPSPFSKTTLSRQAGREGFFFSMCLLFFSSFLPGPSNPQKSPAEPIPPYPRWDAVGPTPFQPVLGWEEHKRGDSGRPSLPNGLTARGNPAFREGKGFSRLRSTNLTGAIAPNPGSDPAASSFPFLPRRHRIFTPRVIRALVRIPPRQGVAGATFIPRRGSALLHPLRPLHRCAEHRRDPGSAPRRRRCPRWGLQRPPGPGIDPFSPSPSPGPAGAEPGCGGEGWKRGICANPPPAPGRRNAAGSSKHCGIHPRTSRPSRASRPPSAPRRRHLPRRCPPSPIPVSPIPRPGRAQWGRRCGVGWRWGGRGREHRCLGGGRSSAQPGGRGRGRGCSRPRPAHLVLGGVRCSAPRRPHKGSRKWLQQVHFRGSPPAPPHGGGGSGSGGGGSPGPRRGKGAGAVRAAPPPGAERGMRGGAGGCIPHPAPSRGGEGGGVGGRAPAPLPVHGGARAGDPRGPDAG